MIEQKITKETLELAKDKGFDLLVCSCGGYPDCICNGDAINQGLLQKWLREKHTIYVSSNFESIGSDEWEYSYEIMYLPKEKINVKRRIPEFKFIKSFKIYGSVYDGAWPTYEEALEQGLQEALKLI